METLVRTTVYELPEEERMAKMQESIIQCSEELQKIETVDELKELEEKLMDDFKEYEAHIKETSYELPDSVEYDGVTRSAKEIKTNVIYFLNQVKVEFSRTLGMYQAIRFWKTNQDNKIPYTVYEGTLQILGTLQFQGENQFRDILIVNNWFAPAHEAYKKDATWQNYLASIHNAILERMKALTSPEPETEE